MGLKSLGFSSRDIGLMVGSIVVFSLVAVLWYNFSRELEPVVNSFEECVDAGYSVMESHPRQCRTPDGETYVEEIDEPEEFEYVEYVSEGGVAIRMVYPQENDTISSPVVVTGEAPGNWAFEADFPIELRDENGEEIISSLAVMQDDWMQEGYVPFEATLEFSDFEPGSSGTLVLIKDNPSDDRGLDDRLELPVQFSD